ncbi:hypothetical protein SASPL_145319 [Salvia splendens]|uniref:Uncharacterized protein n=1 Tax=Salvia splendens TaxID=180675 RepID=A0A8X8WHZ8_SALSN|nr:hypothetical protein SASPL_145319 [Salvia splendens]
MPHRTTYFFPRQFPDRKLAAGDHENKQQVVVDGDKIHGKQLAAFVKWLSDKRHKEKASRFVEEEERLLQSNEIEPLQSEGSTRYAGSLFSGTSLDGNWKAEEEADGVARRYKEGYYLQLMFAKRLTQQAALVTEPLLLPSPMRTPSPIVFG